MSGKILIIDHVATNRIVLKVKLTAAQYDVRTCTTCAEAKGMIAAETPDLVLVNLADANEDRHAFCRNLRNGKVGKSLAIVGTGVDDSSRARFAALDAGADDVLIPHVSDALLLARIRGLLRRRNASLEWQIRDETSRALGFDESRKDFVTPARITVIGSNLQTIPPLVALLQDGLGFRVQSTMHHKGILPQGTCRNADLFIIDATTSDQSMTTVFQLISDIHAQDETQRAEKIVIIPKGDQESAAMLLDLGANDVVFADACAEELTLRTKALISHKFEQDKLRDRVRSGLRASVIDPLTNLYNRRYAESHLKRIADQAHASGRQYALMVVDIDHFKRVNDTYGHQAGDAVLQTVADRLQKSFRTIDLLARIGGEEFLVAMPNTSVDQAHFAAERLRRLINETPFRIAGHKQPLNVTVSVGIAVNGLEDIETTSLDHLFARADAALYSAKSAGRNKVSISMTAA